MPAMLPLLSIAASALLLVQPAAAFWRLPCGSPISVERLDPVVSPGAVSGHVHTIMGASNLAPTVSFDSLRKSQCSTCSVKEDMSLYWTPNLYFQFANGSFVSVPQVGGVLAYYLQRQANASENLLAFPPNFRMIAGSANLRSYNSSSLAQRAISYVCLDYSRGGGVPATPGFPTQDCSDGLRLQVFFPSCWNGKDLDSSDHKSHLAYPSGMDNGKCPPGYPVRLVSLFYEVTFDVYSFRTIRSQAKNPNQPFVLSNGDATGYGLHADFVNGWDVDVLQKAVTGCTDDSGVIEKCPFFSFYSKDAQCRRTPDVNEQALGSMASLPGCNPVTNGPASASSCPDPKPPALVTGQVYTTKSPPAGATLPPGTATTVGKSNGYTYTSCYVDNGPRTLATSLTNSISGAMTVDKCAAACSAGNFKYCGLEYGQECWAANAIGGNGKDAGDGQCGMVCPGNDSQICGDRGLLSLYTKDSYTPTTVTNTSPVGATFAGCYVDNNGGRALTGSRPNMNGKTTVASCIAACKSASFSLAGVEYAGECYCGNSISGANAIASPANDPIAAGCTMPCAGNGSEYCGGPSRLNVYQLSSAATINNNAAIKTTKKAATATKKVKARKSPKAKGKKRKVVALAA